MIVNKGQNGYVKYNKNKNLIKSLYFLGIVVILNLIGRILIAKYALYFTVGSALLILPAAQYMTQFFVFSKYKESSKEYTERYKSVSDKLTILSELILVKGKRTKYLDYVILSDKDIIVLHKTNTDKSEKSTNKMDKVKQLIDDIIKPKGFQYDLVVLDNEEEVLSYLIHHVKGKLNHVDEVAQGKLETVFLQNSI